MSVTLTVFDILNAPGDSASDVFAFAQTRHEVCQAARLITGIYGRLLRSDRSALEVLGIVEIMQAAFVDAAEILNGLEDIES